MDTVSTGTLVSV